MTQNLMFSLSALVALLPASLFPYRTLGIPGRRTVAFWGALGLAVLGPAVAAAVHVGGEWHTGLSTTLWVTIAVCMAIFAVLCAATANAWRLAPLLLPYLVLVGALATLSQGTADPTLRGSAPAVWIELHIAVSVMTYALLTLAAVASLAAFLQERALKAKRPTPLTRFLPPAAVSERFQVRLLAASEVVLGFGLLTGMAVLYYQYGTFLRLDHKTLFSLATFVVIGCLLLVHVRTGMRGRSAARMALIAYLLLTLAYPGVKFVSDVLMR
ncbi:cytochrome C assembly family protein [Azospirillum halopraeferens]|uniref:cytochrome C assembly family protein n=1 Tax=Azospirillum halopraeferens TaxID=34010 RepID=UPI00048D2485|nr:cytochrome c biogenesis protein CcsA [Azospirillum halopraeferens]